MVSDILLQKLSARDRHHARRGGMTGPIEVLLHTDAPLSPEREELLRQAGGEPRFPTHTVLSVGLDDAARLEDIAQLPFIRRIDLDRPMRED